MYSLLLVERYVIEILDRQILDFNELFNRTGLNRDVLKKTVDNLKVMGFILEREGNYLIGDIQRKKISNLANKFKDMEVLDLAQAIVDDSSEGKTLLNIMKVPMTEKEVKILQSYYFNIRTLVEGISKERRALTSENCQVLMLGQGSYSEIVDRYLKCI